MKINNVTLENIFKKPRNTSPFRRSGVNLNPPLNFDVFQKSINFCASPVQNKDFTLEDFDNKKDKFTISEFLSLSEEDRAKIRKEIPEEILNTADKSIDIAIAYKATLDREYGEDSYIFESIGSAPSLIAKAFECMGQETRYLPMTNLTTMYELIQDFDFTNYFDFLKTQGISPEEVKKSDKTLVFCDYTKTWGTLNNFKRLMIKKLGLPPSKLDFRSINEDLEEIYSGDDFDVNHYQKMIFYHYGSRNYTSVARLSISMIDNCSANKDRLALHEREEAKLFNFAVMDNLNKRGLLKYNPENDCTL